MFLHRSGCFIGKHLKIRIDLISQIRGKLKKRSDIKLYLFIFVARFKIGHTPRKNRLNAATSRFIAYLVQSHKHYYKRNTALFQPFRQNKRYKTFDNILNKFCLICTYSRLPILCYNYADENVFSILLYIRDFILSIVQFYEKE